MVKDVSFGGNDLVGSGCHTQPSDWRRDNPEDCIKLCQSIPGCTHFDWVSLDYKWVEGRKRCCLKRGKTRGWIEKIGVTAGYASSSCGSKA